MKQLVAMSDTAATAGAGRRRKRAVPDGERWAYSIDEAAAKAGFSRAWMWELARKGIIKKQTHRGRSWINAEDLREFLRNPPKAS